MALGSGGVGDKEGNEFERLWCVRRMLDVLDGSAVSITPEPPRDAEGVDLLVDCPDRRVEAHQCKAENGTIGNWSIAALKAENILANAARQITAFGRTFVFVSGDPVDRAFSDLLHRTKHCNHDSNLFFETQLSSRKHKRAAQDLADALAVDLSAVDGRSALFRFLSAFDSRRFDRGTARADIEHFARLMFDAEPSSSVSLLESLATTQIGNTIYADTILRSLTDAGIRLRDLRRDVSLAVELERLCDQFEASLTSQLIGGQVIRRAEADEVVKQLTTGDGSRLLIIHGRAGEGKSGVLLDAVRRLRAANTPVLPLRFDRQRPEVSPDYFGRNVCGLPSSPAACLSAIAAGRTAVLVLDQLDAIRWTSAHSASAWDVTESLLQEAMRGPNLRVVIACRTFDVNDHPGIRVWKQTVKHTEVRVGGLSDEAVAEITAKFPGGTTGLTPAQKQLLRNPQLLRLWCLLRETYLNVPFGSATSLLRLFWQDRRAKLEEANARVDAEQVLSNAVDFMDRKGVLAVPRTVIGSAVRAVALLCSLNIFVEDAGGNRLIFSHQSLFDFLLAERIASEVLSGSGKVAEWVKANEQSLFRRGQLRVLLDLLRDDDPATYVHSLRDLITGGGEIRFHLKHLAMQTLGSSPAPSQAEVDFGLGLLQDPKWLNHMFSAISGKGPWFDALAANGTFVVWLNSAPPQLHIALNLLHGVSEERGEGVASLLQPYVGREGDWDKWIAYIVPRSRVERLPHPMFRLYLRVLRLGSREHDVVDWRAIATRPTRCLKTLLAWIRRIENGYGDSAVQLREHTEEDVQSLIVAARAIPARSLKWLIPELLKLRKKEKLFRTSSVDAAYFSDYSPQARRRRIGNVLERTCAAAIEQMAIRRPLAAWRLAKKYRRSGCNRVTRVVLSGLENLPPDQFADRSMRWLSISGHAWLAGRSSRGPEYGPARAVVAAHSRHCSDEQLRRFETQVLSHRPKREWETMRWRLRQVREGHIIPNDVGLGRYLLLSAVPRNRLSNPATDEHGVLSRKFGPVDELLKIRPTSWGGHVTSTIPREKLHLVSDRQWLKIMSRSWSTLGRRWRQMGREHLGEVNHEHFSIDFGTISAREPQRFAELALRIPASADRRYITRLLLNLRFTKPPDGIPVEDREKWRPATVRQLEPIIQNLARPLGDEDAKYIAQIVESRPAGDWSDETLALIRDLAEMHPDPTEDAPGSQDESASWPDPMHHGINSVRGSAVGAIRDLLFEDGTLAGEFSASVDRALTDPTVAVRSVALSLCLPLLNVSANGAVDKFVNCVANTDDRILSSQFVDNVLHYVVVTHEFEVLPIIERMLRSLDKKVVERGAEWVSALWCVTGHQSELFERCLAGAVPERTGVAHTTGRYYPRLKSSPQIRPVLTRLLDDDDKDVRSACLSFGYGKKPIFKNPETPKLLMDAISTKAFVDRPDAFTHQLSECREPLEPYVDVIFAMCDRLVSAHEEDADRFRMVMVGRDLSKLLLRLYEQTEGQTRSDLRRRCLDAWDSLIESRLAYDILQAIDS